MALVGLAAFSIPVTARARVEMPSQISDSDEVTPPPGATQAKSGKGGKMSGYPVSDDKLRSRLPPPPSGNLHLFNPFRGESIKINIFNGDGSYNVDALKALSHFLRCKRTDTETQMEPRLFAILSHVYDHFGERRLEVTSGYRNQRHTTSNHYRGSATDFMVQGISPRKIRSFLETLDSGGMGIGLYPTSGFVHVDVRPPPSYRWIDHSATDPDDPNRRPLPIFKKKKRLQS